MLTNLFDYEHNWEITGPKFFGKRKDFKPMRFFFRIICKSTSSLLI